MPTLDYQPKPPARREWKWFTATNLILAAGCGWALVAGAWAYIGHRKPAIIVAPPPVVTSKAPVESAYDGDVTPIGENGYIIIGASPGGDNRLSVWSSGAELNEYVVKRFLNSEGFGKGRDYESWTLNSSIEVNGTYYIVGSVQLISLNDGEEPFEYINISDRSKSPFKADLKSKKFKHAALDPWQAEGLKQLQAGKEFVQTGIGKHLRLLGAVRVATSCLGCHNVKPGTLLGAFNYSLDGPIDKP